MHTRDVMLYVSQQVSGTNATYFGPISSSLFIPDDVFSGSARDVLWGKAKEELYESLKDKARILGGNAVVGCETILNPFAVECGSGCTGLSLYIKGTATKLDPLF